jgi:hypothetical protein
MTTEDFLADLRVIVTEDGLSDAQRGRLLREVWAMQDEPIVQSADTAHGHNVVDDGSIERHGVGGWNR